MARVVDRLTVQDLRIYHLLSRKRPKNLKTLHFYFTVEDDRLYIFIDSTMAILGKQFVNKKIQGITWGEDNGDWLRIFKTKSDAEDFISNILKSFRIGNVEEFNSELDSIKIRRLKKEKEGKK